MMLCDLLKEAKETGDIVVNGKYALGIAHSDKFNCFVWCNKETGKPVIDTKDPTGQKRVILSLKLLERDDWYLEPLNREVDPDKTKVFLTNNGLVVDSENICRIIKGDGLGNYSLTEVNKKEGTIIYKGNPLMYK